uniref:G-protein coupled receptors family 1 profile domain-containing protein n=1 Tax=Athene cunicularia TaxID=194338 RepID=A0A663MP57_ATHCN
MSPQVSTSEKEGRWIDILTTQSMTEHIPEIVTGSITLLICLCGLVGNGAILWLLGFRIRRNPFTAYLLNLAVADSCFLLCTSVFLVIYHMPMLSCFQPELLRVLPLFHSMVLLMYSTSLYLLTAISVERCVGVLWPFWCRCHRPKLLSAIVCSLLWALAFVFAGLHLSGIVSGALWALAGFFVFSMSLSFSFAEGYETVFAGIAIAIAMILSSMMLISNLLLLIKLQCGLQRRQPGKLYVVVLLSMIFFFALGIPFGVEVFLNLPSSHELLPEKTTFLLALLNSSINPVIYFLVGSCRQRRFQGCVKVALRRVFEEKVVTGLGPCVQAVLPIAGTLNVLAPENKLWLLWLSR